MHRECIDPHDIASIGTLSKYSGRIFLGMFRFRVSPCPSCPLELSPNVNTSPDSDSTIENPAPQLAAMIFGNLGTCVGFVTAIAPPTPSCPWKLLPDE
mmetsp:Transcript_18609/g.23586  ORF Transcript_18609/g.23586 Transcript_18609/m.23586 type:complete len:98 (-) Transcript_18609:549-842(-)